MHPRTSTHRPSVTSILAVALVTAAGCSSGGGGDSTPPAPTPTLAFGAPTITPTGGAGGGRNALTDLNGDGVIDFVVVNGPLANVSVLAGQPDGKVGVGATVPAPQLVAATAFADVDGDRIVDLIAASGALAEAVFAKGRGDGTFEAGAAITLPWAVSELAVVDWNRDGNADLLAASADAGEVALLRGNGAGVFGGAVIASLPYVPTQMVIADMDRDTLPDAIVTGVGAVSIEVLRNDGVGGFLPAVSTPVSGRAGTFVCCDLDRDTLPDLVALDGSGLAVTVYRGVFGASFVEWMRLGIDQTAVTGLALGDLDGDGVLDLAAAAGTRVLVAYGTDLAAFTGVEEAWSGAEPISSVAVVDFAGTGFADIVAVVGGDRVAQLSNPRLMPVGLAGYGVGTPDCRGRIGMWANGVPRIGNADFAYTATNAPADALGVFMQGGPADVLGSNTLGNGVLFHIGFDLLITRLVFSDQLGNAYIADPLPAEPGLVGLPIHTQTLWLTDLATTCTTASTNLASSRGMTATIQQ